MQLKTYFSPNLLYVLILLFFYAIFVSVNTLLYANRNNKIQGANQMNKSNEELHIPDYILDEYEEYIQDNKSQKKWQNLNALINLSTISGRLTQDQANNLKKKYKKDFN